MEDMYEETDVKVSEEVESCCALVDLTCSSKKKRRTKAITEHAEKHKKPRSAYLLYYFDVHQKMQQEHPDMPQSEINKRISDSWKRLTVADKGYYLEKAKMEKDGVDPTTQSSASQDIPGFRKILPRTDYVLLPKTSVGEDRPGASVDICMEGDSPLTLGSEVELVEQCVTVEPLAEDAVVPLSRSSALQAILPQCSTSTGRFLTFPQHSRQSTSLVVKEDGGRALGRAYDMEVDEGFEGVATISSVKAESTHLVAIIPSHELVENKVVPAVNPVMMLPLVNHAKPEPKPSFKLSIKYTRRGRGYCSTPGCSFSYVTRHKPPRCPDCGQHLGGKWFPSAAKKAGPGSNPSPQKLKGHPDGSSSAEVAIQSTVQPSDTVTGQTQAPKSKSDKTVRHPKVPADVSAASANAPGPWRREKMGVVTVYQPAGGGGGAFDKTSDAFQLSGSTAVIGLSGGHVQVISKDTGQKRRIRAILPAPATKSIPSQPAVVQWITVPPSKIKGDTKIAARTVKPQNERILSLKPSTLKQLGHSVSPTALEQKPSVINSSQYVVTDSGVKILSMMPLKKNSGSSLALGLSTARGRGRCKNPSCDYIYKNRHKPRYCPSCGCELTTKASKKANAPSSPELTDMSTLLLDPSQPLTPSQRELQRQSTVTLLKHSLQFPENEAELQEILTHIHNLNQAHRKRDEEDSEKDEEKDGEREEHCGSPKDGWLSFYEPEATHCSLCHCPLYRGGESCSIAGQQQCWLVTDYLLQPVSLQLKVCLNSQCLAVHSFTNLYPGLFNVRNQLLVSLDLFFKIRSQIKQGQDPSLAALDIINNTHSPPGCVLNPDEQTRVQELLCSGYWAFECLTVRDFNDMICGICGIAPKLEIARRDTNSVLQLKNVEFTWPEFQASDEVQVEEFWLAMESEALEQAVFPSNVSITRFDASIIAPFFPVLMRSSVVINTEKDKIITNTEHTGDLCMLMRLIHDGQLKPEQMEQHTEEELQSILEQCGVPSAPNSTKDELMVSVCLLYTQVQNGLSTAPQPAQHLTAGKLSKMCPHQVVCGSKYLVRGESARDHVDLLVSSRFWPPVYVADCAQKVALCTEALYPELASQMWGRNQGCFSDPMTPAECISCPELQDQQYSMDLSSVDSNPRVHPHTKSFLRYIVHPGDNSVSSSDPHHDLTLCKELQSYSSLVSSISGGLEENDSESRGKGKQRKLVFNNAAHFYLYNRLVDFLSSRDVVSQQMAEVLRVCQQGEVVMIRDALYRLGVAQLNREDEETERIGEGEEEEPEGDADTVAVDVLLE
ncbi:HMG domain-containing protein 3 [Neoarius graeffei]|uniref:HMG domain-containing protein 3 n=1 Tax=Neoarius graeffei TaxID=443677 RepID=UPI00298D1CA9|nr:HMG domain-containing protein 3 [Neoarius graeffei]XP_060771182.1 HMG domain-containing protein 3 [Neoarius graeffei]